MNTEDFINYAVMAILLAAGCAYLLWDAWLDRQPLPSDECCPRGYGCDKCYYGLPK